MEYLHEGRVNPAQVYANPDPLSITSPYVNFTQIRREADGRVQLSLLGTMNTPVRIQYAANLSGAGWNTRTNRPSLNGALQYPDRTATNAVQRYYRTVAP